MRGEWLINVTLAFLGLALCLTILFGIVRFVKWAWLV